MNKMFIIVAIVVILLIVSFKPSAVNFNEDVAGGIQFKKESWNDILKIAKRENKLIFLDIYATWCGPCKRLKSKTFSDVEVGKLYNQTFINVSLDGEKGEGLALARKYGVRGYPTLLFLDGNGTIIAQTGGYYNPEEFIELGKTVTKK